MKSKLNGLESNCTVHAGSTGRSELDGQNRTVKIGGSKPEGPNYLINFTVIEATTGRQKGIDVDFDTSISSDRPI